MGSSSRRHRKSASRKARHDRHPSTVKIRLLRHTSARSDAYSDSEEDYRRKKSNSKLIKKQRQISPGSDQHGRFRGRNRLEHHSRSRERKNQSKKRRIPSSDFCSTCSSWSSSSSEENLHERSRGYRARSSRDKRRRRKEYSSSLSRSCSCCSGCSTSSCSQPLKQVNSVAVGSKELERKVEEIQGNSSHQGKPEVIQSLDDYPSSKSNESNDGEGKEQTGVRPASTALMESMQCVPSVCPDLFGDDNLESRLRQKALENLAKFRLRQPANEKNGGNKEGKEDVFTHSELLGSTAKLPERDDINIINRKKNCSPTNCHQEATAVPMPVGKLADSDNMLSKPSSMATYVADKEGQVTQKSAVGTSCTQLMENNEVRETGLMPSSYQCSMTGDDTEGKGGGKHTSELEQKTMSVMHGGELVQVNYQVYIPKKAPALSRRKLQR